MKQQIQTLYFPKKLLTFESQVTLVFRFLENQLILIFGLQNLIFLDNDVGAVCS